MVGVDMKYIAAAEATLLLELHRVVTLQLLSRAKNKGNVRKTLVSDRKKTSCIIGGGPSPPPAYCCKPGGPLYGGDGGAGTKKASQLMGQLQTSICRSAGASQGRREAEGARGRGGRMGKGGTAGSLMDMGKGEGPGINW